MDIVESHLEPGEVPEQWRALGFSGTFMLEAALRSADHSRYATPAECDEFEAKLPDRIPFGTNSAWLALRLNREADPVTVVIVRQDSAAIVDMVTGGPARLPLP